MSLLRKAFSNRRYLVFSRVYINTLAGRMDQKEKALKEVEQVLTDNPYYSKYADKIKKLSPQEMEQKLKEIDSVKKKFNNTIVEQTADNKVRVTERTYDELFKPKPAGKAVVDRQKEVTLGDIMKLEAIEKTISSKEELDAVWMAYHKDEALAKNKDKAENYLISGVIGADKYKLLQKNSKTHPVFLLPLPRETGYEFFLVQFHLNEIHITSLLCYQVHKENAPECLKLVHFTEYSEKFGTVLMRGEFNKNVVNELEVSCLINQLQLFYCSEAESPKKKIMEKFTKNPDSFDHMEIIKEIENLQML